MCSLPDGYGSMETQKNLGADEVSVARNALRDAQCACAAASISAGRYGCTLRAWLVGGQAILPPGPPSTFGLGWRRSQLATRVSTASAANNPAATMRTALNGIFRAASLPSRITGTS